MQRTKSTANSCTCWVDILEHWMYYAYPRSHEQDMRRQRIAHAKSKNQPENDSLVARHGAKLLCNILTFHLNFSPWSWGCKPSIHASKSTSLVLGITTFKREPLSKILKLELFKVKMTAVKMKNYFVEKIGTNSSTVSSMEMKSHTNFIWGEKLCTPFTEEDWEGFLGGIGLNTPNLLGKVLSLKS